ncbi:hypothetical protein NQD34_013456, partial [Periophthalmus magnuspinnatus]
INVTLPDPHCSNVPLSNLIFIFFLTDYMLLVPLFTYVPVIAYQAWRSSKPAAYSDILTFNNIIFEFMNIFALLVYCSGTFVKDFTLIVYGLSVFSVICCGQTILHVLMCVERYVAVVHPVMYLKLKQTKTGERIRNVCIICVWLSFDVSIGFVYISRDNDTMLPYYIVLAICMVVVLFCTFTVLHTLVKRSPGENTHKQRIDPSKRKALKTIMLILVALVLRIIGIPV